MLKIVKNLVKSNDILNIIWAQQRREFQRKLAMSSANWDPLLFSVCAQIFWQSKNSKLAFIPWFQSSFFHLIFFYLRKGCRRILLFGFCPQPHISIGEAPKFRRLKFYRYKLLIKLKLIFMNSVHDLICIKAFNRNLWSCGTSDNAPSIQDMNKSLPIGWTATFPDLRYQEHDEHFLDS